ncbi:MAG: FeoA family protein [Actinomycetota bacterium]|nr:FeoA family protein [Actinomycetota bacterium]
MFRSAGRLHRHGRGDPNDRDTVVALRDGERATVIGVRGGGQMEARLVNMGLRPGKTITKLAALPGRGPVTVEVDGCRVALGHGIARKLLVERSNDPG